MSHGKSIDRVAITLASVLGLLVSLTTLGEKLGTLSSTKLFAYLYVAKDLIPLEIVLLILCLLSRNTLVTALRRGAAAVPVIWKHGPREQLSLALTAIGLIVGLLIGSYHAYYYCMGKKYALDYHAGMLADRASRELLRGDYSDARFVVNICINAYGRVSPCRRVLASLDRRASWCKLIARIYRETSANSRWRSALALAIYMQDRNWVAYEHRLNLEEQRRIRLDALYREGLKKAASGDVEGAALLLRPASGGFNYGRANEIIRELDEVKAGKGAGVMLNALKQYGASRFADEVTKSSIPLRLKAPVDELYESGDGHIDPHAELRALVDDLERGWHDEIQSKSDI